MVRLLPISRLYRYLSLGKGLWPAFWLLGSDIKRVYGTLHGPGYSASHGVQGHTDLPAAQAVDSAFHVYAVDWTPDQVKLSVDGAVYATRTPQDLPAGKSWAYIHPFFMLLNFAVGGKWPGNPDDTTRFPQQVLFDCVRVYHL